MQWSIGEWNDETIEFNEDYTAVVDGKQLDDGVHKCVYSWIDDNYQPMETSFWLFVKNGEFCKETSIRFITTARNALGYWGEFIEGFHFDDEGRIEVVIGS